MLDTFLKVAYAHDKEHEDQLALARNMERAFTVDELKKLASGDVKMAFPDCGEEWVSKFKGTALLDQAVQLERQDIENDIAREQAQQAMPSSDQFYRTGANIRLQKKMLDLQLIEQSTGAGAAGAPPGPSPVGLESAGPAPLADLGGGAGPDEKAAAARFQKTALVGPVLDIANLGIPSAVGYAIGHGKGQRDVENDVPEDKASLLAGAMIPGYIGYRYGKGEGREQATAKKNKKASANFAKAASDTLPYALGHGILNPLLGSGTGALAAGLTTHGDEESPGLRGAGIGGLAGAGLGAATVAGLNLAMRAGAKRMGMSIPSGVPGAGGAALRGALLGGLGGALGGAHAGHGVHRRINERKENEGDEKEASAFAKAAAGLNLGALGQQAMSFAKANPKAVGMAAGGLLGAAGGAMAGGEGHRLSGALSGATAGAALGHAGAGIGTRMARGQGLGQAASGYATNLKRNAQVGAENLKRGWNAAGAAELPAKVATPMILEALELL